MTSRKRTMAALAAALASVSGLTVPVAAADTAACTVALWNEPYETITLPPIMSYQRFTLEDQGLSVRIISAEEDTYGLESVTLSCPADASTYFRRLMELHELAGDSEPVSVASLGDESIGYRYPVIEAYEIVWRRGDVIGRGDFPDAILLDTAEDLVRKFDTMLEQP